MGESNHPSGSVGSGEVAGLAREMGKAYRDMLRYYKQREGLSPEEAEAKMQAMVEAGGDRLLASPPPPEELSWWDLNDLAEVSEEQALAAWERTKEAAAQELSSGLRSARALEGYAATPWDRARFLAIRSGMMEDWQPRDAVEESLVDMLAQAYHQYLFWTERAMVRATTEAEYQEAALRNRGRRRPLPVSQAEEVEQASAMADRYNRIFMRTLRAMRDLRRYMPTVNIRQAGQVNIGQQQVNAVVAKEERWTPANDD